jgi:hypothetical protein
MVLLALAPPTVRDNELAEEERLKPGWAMIVNEMVVAAVSDPEVPVTVTE